MKTWKRAVSFLLCLTMLTSAIAGVSFAADIVASGECGDQGNNVTWTLDSAGTLTISGTGAMRDYSYKDSPWYTSRNSVKTVDIKAGVTSIGGVCILQLH